MDIIELFAKLGQNSRERHLRHHGVFGQGQTSRDRGNAPGAPQNGWPRTEKKNHETELGHLRHHRVLGQGQNGKDRADAAGAPESDWPRKKKN